MQREKHWVSNRQTGNSQHATRWEMLKTIEIKNSDRRAAQETEALNVKREEKIWNYNAIDQ